MEALSQKGRVMKSMLERPDDQTGHEDHGHEHGGIFGVNTELVFALICGALS